MSRQVTLVSIGTLRPNSRNARTHSKKQVQQIASSIQRFGWTYPLLVDEAGVILAGHGRLSAAKVLGLKEVPVLTVSHLSEAEKRALVIADNKIAENAGWDREILAAELGALAGLLPEVDLTLDITGFEPAEIDGLMVDFLDRENDPADELPVPAKELVSRRGDLWILGRHRLLCGDATDAADVQMLMGNERAAVAFMDPPYNVRVASIQGRGAIKHKEFVAGSGEMSEAEFTDFLTKAFGNAAAHALPGSIHFVCCDWRHISELQAAQGSVQRAQEPRRLEQDKREPGQLLSFAT